MNITKELLEQLGVVSMTLESRGTDYVCFLRRVSGKILTLSLMRRPDFTDGDTVMLKIARKKDGGISVEETSVNVSDCCGDCCSAVLPENIADGAKTLFDRLSFLEFQDEKYGRRKEERLPVGKANFRAFGLSSPEQTLFAGGARLTLPCAVLDVSLHGIRVITPFSVRLDALENFGVKISFDSPAETVILKAHRVHARLDRAGEKVFATLACQLLEPVPWAWKRRVIALIKSPRQQERRSTP